MLLRLLLTSFVALALACASSEPFADSAERRSESPPTLEVEGGLELSLLTNRSEPIVVRLRDPSRLDLQNVPVDFALMGLVPGASLSPSRALTDATGVARTVLSTGSMSADLTVRASAPGADPVYVKVSVRELLSPLLTTRLEYQGRRDIRSFTVTVVEGMRCSEAEAAGAVGDVSHTFDSRDTAVSFSVQPGTLAALLAWGRDQTGAKVARGCSDYQASYTDDAQRARDTVVITLEDTPLALDTALPLELALDVGLAAELLGDTVELAVREALAAKSGSVMFAEADYYLDALASALQSAGDASAYGTLSDARAQSAGLSASLAPALAQAEVGPRALGALLARTLAERGAVLALQARYDGSAGALVPLGTWRARASDGLGALALASLHPETSLRAQFEPDAAELVVESLGVRLGLGSYGRALLEGLKTDSGTQLATKLAEASGCATTVARWAQRELSGICAPSAAVRACEQAVAALVSKVEASLVLLDVGHESLTLSGILQAHDRTDDGRVDDLGAGELDGSWGGVLVAGEVSRPVETALAL